jgi:hypothetical protein
MGRPFCAAATLTKVVTTTIVITLRDKPVLGRRIETKKRNYCITFKLVQSTVEKMRKRSEWFFRRSKSRQFFSDGSPFISQRTIGFCCHVACWCSASSSVSVLRSQPATVCTASQRNEPPATAATQASEPTNMGTELMPLSTAHHTKLLFGARALLNGCITVLSWCISRYHIEGM